MRPFAEILVLKKSKIPDFLHKQHINVTYLIDYKMYCFKRFYGKNLKMNLFRIYCVIDVVVVFVFKKNTPLCHE